MKLLDYLVRSYPEETREQLFSAILCGDIKISGGIIRDPKFELKKGADLQRISLRYVSRGALKLERALELWNWPVSGRVFIDAGCSTGGFTDVLLRNGAAHVYSVDVGRNQLAYSLRNHDRVTPMEKTNILSLRPDCFSMLPQGAVADLSFRSVIEPAEHLFTLISGDEVIVLLKPQFEWKNPPSRFHGVISDKDDLKGVVRDFFAEISEKHFRVLNAALSPVKGSRGNREFLLHLHRTCGLDDPCSLVWDLIDQII